MASVSSLDQDMRKLRMDRYTPQAAEEVRSWIEETLGERLPPGDLLDILKDGVTLCKLANSVLPPPGIRYKASTMPFTQRENISQFLTACERAPLNMHAHDRFLTVDLYDNKDPAQVLQCIGAFSRAANAANPTKFRNVIGPRKGAASPTRKTFNTDGSEIGRARGSSNASQGSAFATDGARALSPTSNTNASVSTWSKKTDEMTSAPAWNIHQYGYMGGASQGNQGVSFGSRRQIISPNISVPNLAEKERRRKELQIDADRQRKEEEELEQQRRLAQQQDERRRKMEDDERREAQIREAREQERRQVELEKHKWEEEERKWRDEEERRNKEEEEETFHGKPAYSLNGQYQSSYLAEQAKADARQETENGRIQELERQLEEAKERELQYQREREERNRKEESAPREISERRKGQSQLITAPVSLEKDRDSWGSDERRQLRQAWSENQSAAGSPAATKTDSSRPLPDVDATGSLQATPKTMRQKPSFSRFQSEAKNSSSPSTPNHQPDPRPLPNAPAAPNSTPHSSPASRTDQFLAHNPAPTASQPRSHFPQEIGMTPESERAAEDARRIASQQKTKAGGWASKSLLEKEMERERMRQREWEEAQATRMQGGTGQNLMGPRELRR